MIYDVESLFNFKFYKKDGSFIISFAPLLIFPFLYLKFNIEKLLKAFLIFAVSVYTLLFLYFSMNKVSVLSSFRGLFDAHNAAGGFLSFLTGICFVFWRKNKSYKYFFAFLLCVFMLLQTQSRGSLLGLILGIVFFYFWRQRLMLFTKIIIFSIIAVQVSILIYSYPIYKKYNIGQGTSIYEYIYTIDKSVDGKTANIYIRAFDNWPKGLELFFNSPILGTGFGSLNDTPYDLKGVPGLFSYNAKQGKVFDSAHAHHSYIHVLGEQGLLGFFALLAIMVCMYNFIVNNKQNQVVQSILFISFFNLVIMSFTENRFTSPSNALPFVILLCLYIIYVNGSKKELALNG
ncbi:O-antigen ligase family protein [Algibacter pacificus]|uniref:O-antigen ligase family protein n=1 Tax=Algibacter pacificus TaxID=2599389 RepID=UPI0016508AFB|nr:O-antigen ligase family protein [Algibacter pacificus]